jgi:quinol monooxygenase YgiN
MMARIATFPTLPPEMSAEVRRNVLERFMPAIRAQDGFVAGYWLADEDGTWISFSIWESEAAMERAGQRANATPLLPGLDPNKIPSPATTQILPVVAYARKD